MRRDVTDEPAGRDDADVAPAGDPRQAEGSA